MTGNATDNSEVLNIRFSVPTSLSAFGRWLEDYGEWRLPVLPKGSADGAVRPQIEAASDTAVDGQQVVSFWARDFPIDAGHGEPSELYQVYRFILGNGGHKDGLRVQAVCYEDQLCKAFLHLLLKIVEVWPASGSGICGPAQDAARQRANERAKMARMAAIAHFPSTSANVQELEEYRTLADEFDRHRGFIASPALPRSLGSQDAFSDEKPWEQIPDYRWDREAVRGLWEGKTSPRIAASIGEIDSKTVDNRLSLLRKQFPEQVPTRAKLKEMDTDSP